MTTPLTGRVDVLDPTPDHVTATFTVSADEPVLEGHYRDYPIFPGVCVVECVHQAATRTAPAPVALAAMTSVRFLAPVHPGDTITITLTWRPQEAGTWSCEAKAAVDDRPVASTRLTYRETR